MLLGALWTASCGSADNRQNVAGAAVTTAVAATVWAAADGCRLQGCPWGTFCNEAEGLCEKRSCGQGGGCPKGSYCNEQIDRCEDMPSAIQMNPPPGQPPPDSHDPNLQRPVTPAIPY